MPLSVDCRPSDAGWSCAVIVGDDATATHHEVKVASAELARLHPGAPDPEALVRAAFDFLLSQEPRESILSEFDLPLIGAYFPGWEAEVAGRLLD